MIYAAIFIIILVIVSGLIAYIGDILGRRMGKKRLTLFGLRPRHTAIIVTIITGMLIASITLIALLGFNAQIRKALVSGQEIIKQNIELAARNKQLRDMSRDLLEAEKQMRKQLDETKAELAKMEKTAKETNEALKLSRQKLADTTAKLASERQKLNQTRQQLAQARTGLEKITKAGLEIAKNLRAADVEYSALRRGKVIFMSGQEISRTVVKPRPSIPAMRTEVILALNEASRKAIKFGAKPGKNGRAVVIATKTISVVLPDGKIGSATYGEAKSLDSIAESLSKSTVPTVLQIVTVGNAIEGEQVTVEVQLYRNKLIFQAGETVASTIINASKPRGELLNDLAHFLSHEVRNAAMDSGIIPVANPQEPEKMFGEVGMDKLLDVLDRIKNTGGNVKVKAISQRDVYAAGPLQLDFIISKA